MNGTLIKHLCASYCIRASGYNSHQCRLLPYWDKAWRKLYCSRSSFTVTWENGLSHPYMVILLKAGEMALCSGQMRGAEEDALKVAFGEMLVLVREAPDGLLGLLKSGRDQIHQ